MHTNIPIMIIRTCLDMQHLLTLLFKWAIQSRVDTSSGGSKVESLKLNMEAQAQLNPMTGIQSC